MSVLMYVFRRQWRFLWYLLSPGLSALVDPADSADPDGPDDPV